MTSGEQKMEKQNVKGHRRFCRTIIVVFICLAIGAGIFMLRDILGKDNYQKLRYKMTYQNLRFESESDVDKIYETAVHDWIREINNSLDNNQGDISEYIDGWDTLTDIQQQAVIDIIKTSETGRRIAKVLDKRDDIIPVAFPQENDYLNGAFHIYEDCTVTLERNDESHIILESYLCPNCNGTGQAIMPQYSCSACKGKGEICIKYGKYNPESGWEDVTIPCDKCPLGTCKLCGGYKYCSIIKAKEWRTK